jgi:hypothetical protein
MMGLSVEQIAKRSSHTRRPLSANVGRSDEPVLYSKADIDISFPRSHAG